MGKIAIHGFGRIGRSLMKAGLKANLFSPVSVSDIRDIPTLAALFEVDSNYGRWHEPVEATDKGFIVGGREVLYFNTQNELPNWGDLGVDVVVDCTGRATLRAGAQAHLDKGAKKVLVSAASKSLKDCDIVLMAGINKDAYDPATHHIVSMASCTTNALAPVVKVLLENFGIKSSFFSTVHAYTNTQSLTDQPMKDRRDSWAAAENIIPSSSGAAKALLFIWPDLKITGKAYRVPTRTGSIAEINAVLNRDVTVDEVKEAFIKASETPQLKGVMGVLHDEWASSRIVGDSHSSIIDLPLISVIGGNMVSVAAWYDNEMGYATRLAEVAAHIAG
ncbi:MAG: aldehyde dehydrogenase [Chloroflexi bacterium]|nr:MAG: glyceraldehyde-3-phosphate dehydrogenase [Chloroflexi bacterium OLB13]MBC6956097.1 aldehyde dehydrogenase [Chloroflexota bacterium]MBV6435250.1 Glyceraldehyde-3-phosphate dehydrogenase [Anaerolineae bacterium]MDL1915626.1 aldehyde dehydrogenase [Anaerolineae bacterium CFX4]OQY80125.1 MAG: glyceraldehyde-3-phosphate dehydrogenase [Anaerolineae bacterium UTCFX5]